MFNELNRTRADMRRLRRQMMTHYLLRGRLPVEGFSSVTQMASLAQTAQQVSAPRIAEIGFNAGFSAAAFLSTGPDVEVVSFDLDEHGVVPVAKGWIDRRFPGRHELVLGDSRDTVPAYAAAHPSARFDVVFIDGGHEFEVAWADLVNMMVLSTAATVVVMDDVVPAMAYGVGPSQAWEKAISAGLVVQDRVTRDGRLRCWAHGHYLI